MGLLCQVLKDSNGAAKFHRQNNLLPEKPSIIDYHITATQNRNKSAILMQYNLP